MKWMMMAVGLLLMGGGVLRADVVQWMGKDTAGAEVRIPTADRVCVVVFVRPEQAQSREALQRLAEVLKDRAGVGAIVIVSGESATEDAKKLKAGKECPWPVAVDVDYTAYGKMAVRVLPTTVVVSTSGEMVAHLGGLNKHYGKDLDSYLALAAKRIDEAELKRRLAQNDVVGDSAEQIASRHFQVAQRLMDKGLVEQAAAELRAALKLHPESATLKVATVQAMLALGQAKEAEEVLGQLQGTSLPAWQMKLLRGKAMAQLGKWDEAAGLLDEATRLNPQPAEAWYELGRVYEHRSEWRKAAEAFRHAFEATEMGRKVRPTTREAE